MSAILTIRAAPDLGPDVKRFELGCRHGTTTALWMPGRFELTDADVTRTLLLRHFAGTPCGCIRRLWREHLGAEQPEVRLA